MSWPVRRGSGGATAISAMTAVAIAAGDLIYITGAGEMDLADATAEGKEAVGYANAAFGSGVLGEYFNGGLMEGLAGLTPGNRYFMTTTPGAVGVIPTTTGNVVLCVGTAASATTLNFNLETPVTL